MEERFHAAVNVEGGRAVLSVYGELDLAHAPLLDHALDDPQIASASTVLLDVRELRFLDSSGLRAVLSAQERCRMRGQDFAVTPASGQVKRLLNITRASDELPIVAAPDGRAAAESSAAGETSG